MTSLAKPSPALAAALLSEIGFEDRFVGVKMSPKAGNRLCSIYSFEEAIAFFYTDSLGTLVGIGGGSALGYLDLSRLQGWVREVFGDQELAEKMGKEIEKNKSYVDTARNVRKLMQQRLDQCKKARI
jgi:hypothetical protein